MKLWSFGNKAPEANPLADRLDAHELRQEVAVLRDELAQVKNQGGSFPLTDYEKWQDFFGGGPTYAGQAVDENTSMKTSAVFACVSRISSAVACAPVKVYMRNGDLRERTADHRFSKMLALRPNRFMTASTFWKAFMQDKLLMGNAYAVIERGKFGAPVALIPVKARNARVDYAWELGVDQKLGVERNRLYYTFTFEDGNRRTYDQEDVLHVPNVGWNGKYGMSTVRAMAQAVGLALAAERSSGDFFENGMQSQIAISIPGNPTEEATARLVEHLKSRHSGAGNHHKPLVLFNDGKASTLSMTAEDAQLLESRKFSVIDICRFFGVHPVMIGENEKTSSFGGGIEQMGRWFNTLTLNEHFTSIEQEMEAKLFGDGHFAEFDETEITRGDTKSRSDYLTSALGSLQQPGWMTVNEARASEGLPPVRGGDEILKPENANSSQPAQQGGTQ